MPDGFDKKAWASGVWSCHDSLVKYVEISNAANKEALPHFYEAGVSARKLLESKTREQLYSNRVVQRFANQCHTTDKQIYECIMVSRAWTKAEFQKLVDRGLTYSHIVRLAAVRTDDDRKKLAAEIVSEGLTVEATSQRIKQEKEKNPEYVTTRSSTTAKAKERARARQLEDPEKAMGMFNSKVEAFLEVCGTLTIGLKNIPKLPAANIVKLKKMLSEAAESVSLVARTAQDLKDLLTAADSAFSAAEKEVKEAKKKKSKDK